MNPHVDISSEVAVALAENRPVVALESTLIAHGLPYPRNLEVAAAMRAAVRSEGAVPAVIAVLGGRIVVGVDDAGLQGLIDSADALKVSRRDLAFAVSTGRYGGTTVAATMICARLAGISVFATGGIGGVHRGHGETMDISADLDELAVSRVAVVCAGAKAILDLPRTLEYLETAGVPVVAYGADAFPAFYMRDSGLVAPLRLDTPDEIAALMAAHWGLGLDGGIVIAQPAPDDATLDRDVVETAITSAMRDASSKGISGKALTPFLLDLVADMTGGDSLDANAALIENNARLAGKIAVAYAGLGRTASAP